ncbi:MAG: zinc-binding alcohol dehydrogenase family protein [Pseudomonadota bacterium]
MKAIGHERACPIDDEDALVELDIDVPTPGPHDLLVAVRGVSMNPVDVKVRALMAPEDGPRILGWDAAGIVETVGDSVTRFKPGDAVFYAGDLTRPGSNAERQLVDERIVGRKPDSLDFTEAAGIPLTAITAWEMLFDSFGLKEGDGEGSAILVIGGAGGVGSMLIQLAKALTKLEVIATASRPETERWVKRMGADHVINHREPLDAQIQSLGIAPQFVAALTNTDEHIAAIVELIKPRGHIALIDDPEALDIIPLKFKAITLSWEFMFTRSMFATEDMAVQHALLNRVADMLDAGTLQSTANKHGGAMSVDSLREAHRFQESGRAIGKTVLDGFATQTS